MFDLIIKGGIICDGSGAPCYKGDIGIREGRIEAVGTINEEAVEVIFAEGLIAAPGFIDCHAHSEIAQLVEADAIPKVTQGVTTEFVGNCGISAFPLASETRELSKRYSSSVLAFKDEEWTWDTLEQYNEKLVNRGTAVNIASLAGHGSIRIAVMGFEDRKATAEELEKMKQLLRQALKQGAFGMTTGLAYVPGCYADLNELTELTKVVAEYKGVYATHLRNQSDTLVECSEEAIEIGRKTGASIEISHLKAVGKINQKNALKVLQLIEEAQKQGLNVNADQYPYTFGSSTLTAILPPWTLEGGVDEMIKRLKDPKCRKQICHDLKYGINNWENRVDLLGWEKIYVTSVVTKKNKHLEGHNLLEIANIEGKSPEDAVFDLLLDENGEVGQIDYTSSEETLKEIMKKPFVMFGSDGLYADEGKSHPRLYGCFPRILGKYCREEKVIPLEEAVRKMTYLPAQKFGLADRGLLKEGMAADIVIFDKDEIGDYATFENPCVQSKGIHYVLVNGELVLDKGKITGKLPGKVLKHSFN